MSILKNGPDSFAGRKLGLLVSDGADAAVVAGLQDAVKAVGGLVEIVAPQIGGVRLSDGRHLPAHQRVDGGPSVLYDAVALVPGADSVSVLAAKSSAKDFVTDAFAHHKFVAHTASAQPLLDAAGVTPDDGFFELTASAPNDFVTALSALRFWDRDVQP